MAELFCDRNHVWINTLHLLIIVLSVIQLVGLHPTSAQENGFLSIDCGSAAAMNYKDSSTKIEWVPDALIWPDIRKWSSTAQVSPPTAMADQRQYSTLRYFPSNNKPLNQSKFCYNLAAIPGDFYLIRASFWYGSSTVLGTTRTSGTIRFHVIVDTYEGVEIAINLPQTYPWFEEMYIRAQSGKDSVSVCLSAASNSSDVPFISSLELRPLPSTMMSVQVVQNNSYALRTVVRQDSGTSSTNPPILRYPDDTLDRLWWRGMDAGINVYTTDSSVMIRNSDLPPQKVMSSNYLGGVNGYSLDMSSDSRILTTSTLKGSHYYYLIVWFAEIDPSVNASGQRVFNLTTNGERFFDGLDVFEKVGSFSSYGIYTPSNRPVGPYEGKFIIEGKSTFIGSYPPTLAAMELLQRFNNTMDVQPTSSTDVLALRDLTAGILPGLQNFMGDPCLPQQYKYSWIGCNFGSQLPTPRVTSISLSNSGLVGNLPTSIDNLEQLSTIVLSGNALEGTLPSLSNLVNLQVLNLSNNRFSGAIPDSLSNLPKLTYLNIANNNFQGVIPPALRQKQGLTFIYGGNPGLCDDVTCKTPTKKGPSLGLIIGISIGALLFLLIIVVTIVCCILKWRKNQISKLNPTMSTDVPTKKEDLVKKEQLIHATKVAKQFSFEELRVASNGFSEVLGRGGFGTVYKGRLDGSNVAIKMLSNTSQQGPQEFLNEVTVLSRVHHRNLVGFVGYSIEESLILVYEYMPNGSLYDELSRKNLSPKLTWTTRLQVLRDAAQGLAYLHHGRNIIHRDVKSSNILLSENLEGKMSDFGISKVNQSDTYNATTRIVGTKGYLDPAYANSSQLTTNADIYSFGVVLLEAICGQPPIIQHTTSTHREIHIIDWVKASYENGFIEEVVDERLEGKYSLSSIWKVAEIAIACTQSDVNNRPTMADVVNDLGEAIRMAQGEYYESSEMGNGEVQSHSYMQPR